MEATIQYIRQELSDYYPENEIRAFERVILEHICGLNYTQQVLLRKQKLDERFKLPVSGIIERLKAYEPIQYILGETAFCGLTLKVTPSVFIPRPETEELVQWITETTLPEKTQVLDVGTGSGCIALGIKQQFPQVNVSAMDISEDALETARQNAGTNGLKIRFIQANILRWENYTWETFGVIVSNPPYVQESEKKVMFPNVLKYEPPKALFVPDSDPLLFYRRIATFARRYLIKNGWLYFEINENLGDEIANLLKSKEFRDIEIKKDLFGKNRMIRCKK